MTPMLDLWLPVVLGAVLVFAAGAVLWMCIPGWHNPDMKVLPDEAAFTADLKKHSLSPGRYMWPNCNTGAEMQSDEFKARWESGPWGVLSVPAGKPNFAKNLGITFAFNLAVCAATAFLASKTFGAGAAYWDVFAFTGIASGLAFATMGLPHSVYNLTPRRGMITNLVDGVIYALLVAGTFAGLWPELPLENVLIS